MIEPVTYYKVRCDWPDCRVSTESLGGEYSAWSDSGAAVDEWVNDDGVVLEKSQHAFCHEHSLFFRCPECGEMAVTFMGLLPDVSPMWNTSTAGGTMTTNGVRLPDGTWRCRECVDEMNNEDDGTVPQ